jgi:hypothetical protein
MLLPACLYSLEARRGAVSALSAAKKKKKKVILILMFVYLLQFTLIRRDQQT